MRKGTYRVCGRLKDERGKLRSLATKHFEKSRESTFEPRPQAPRAPPSWAPTAPCERLVDQLAITMITAKQFLLAVAVDM